MVKNIQTSLLLLISLFFLSDIFSQDTLYFRNGDTRIGTVEGIDRREIRFRNIQTGSSSQRLHVSNLEYIDFQKKDDTRQEMLDQWFLPKPKRSRYPYRAWVTPGSDTLDPEVHYFLDEAGDTGIWLISKSALELDPALVADQRIALEYRHIQKLDLRSKGRIGRGMAIGGLAGLTIGGAWGLLTALESGAEEFVQAYTLGLYQPEKDPAEQSRKAVRRFVGFTVGGAIAGGLFSSGRITFYLHGKNPPRVEMIERLKMFSDN